MSAKISHVIWLAIFSLTFVGVAHAQHNFQLTKTVVKAGGGDFTTIQAAIDALNTPSVGGTVLIYAGTYPENVTLGTADENIDLVGIDRESVIIAPSTGDGILITSGAETSRNNSIRNLTINTTTGHGIKIVKGATPAPKDITIEGVTINAVGTDKTGITGVDAIDVLISNCDVSTAAGHGVVTGDQWTLRGVTVLVDDTTPTTQDAVVLGDHDFIVLEDCDLTGERRALHMDGSEDVLVQGCRIWCPGTGGATNIACVVLETDCKRVTFQNCLIVSDATGLTRIGPAAVFIDDTGGGGSVVDIVFQSCRISAIGGTSSVRAAAFDHDLEGFPKLLDCEISATNAKTTSPAAAVGVEGGTVVVIGGVITTSSVANDETEVWDITTSPNQNRMSGTQMSKWKGPLKAAGRQATVTQRLLSVTVADADILVDDGDLDGDPITVASPDLATYRAIQVTWNSASGDDITIVAVGTNWAGDRIREAFVLSTGTPQKDGDKPFKTVDTIYIPDAPGSIDVGTTDKLGLYYPLSATTDVLQEAKLVSNVYTTQSVGTVDAVYSTIIPSSALTFLPSFEWMLLTSP